MMKNTKITNIFYTVLLMLGCHVYAPVKAQSANNATRPGISIDRYVNGNGHGAFYNISATLSINRNRFYAGPVYQTKKKKFNGIKLMYSYSVTGVQGVRKKQAPLTHMDEDTLKTDMDIMQEEEALIALQERNCRVELNFFCSFQYYRKALLSDKTLEGEGDLTHEKAIAFSGLQLNTVETFAGIGYNYLLTKNVKLRSFVAIGVYYHTNFSETMYHSAFSPVLMTGIGIGLIK